MPGSLFKSRRGSSPLVVNHAVSSSTIFPPSLLFSLSQPNTICPLSPFPQNEQSNTRPSQCCLPPLDSLDSSPRRPSPHSILLIPSPRASSRSASPAGRPSSPPPPLTSLARAARSLCRGRGCADAARVVGVVSRPGTGASLPSPPRSCKREVSSRASQI